MERKRGWIILAFFSLLFGCATTEDVRILDGEIYRLQSQVNGIQKEKDTGKGDLVAFRKEIQNGISALQAETQKLQTEAQRIKADFLLQKESLQSEMRTLSTQVEEYKEFLKRPQKEIDRVKEDVQPKLRLLEDKGKAYEERSKVLEDRSRGFEERMKRVEDRFKGLETKIGGLETKIGGLEAKTGELATKQMQMEAERPVPAKEKEPIPETRGVSTVVGDLYRDAYETYQKGNLEDARRRFEAFLKQYPNTELSDNAQFWIGETYYLKRDFEKAILEYEKASTKYPEGDKVPAALFKQALAFSELGDKTNARSTLRKVMERYPHSDQADMARKRLEAIK
jgi:tol-pal system protein YbgF